MNVVTDVLAFVANNIFGQVPILIGLITLAGLALQRKRIEDLIGGTLRATIGIVILFIGVDVFVQGLVSFQAVLASAMGTEPPKAEHTLTDFFGTHGGSIALVITLGFVIHLALVRIFPAARYLYLSGHLMFWVSAITVAALVEIAPEANQLTVVLCGSAVVACYWTLQPLWMRKLMGKVVDHDKFGFGHTSSLVGLLTGWIAKPLGDPDKHNTEKLKLPRQIGFFKDVNVSTALIISLIMLVAVSFADPEVAATQAATVSEGLSPWVWAILVGLKFAAGLAVVLFGVRMFLAEIVPAFKGVSDKLIPGTRPALDAPTIFPAAPTAVMVGFVAATSVFLVLIGVFAVTGWFTLAPPMIMLFFVGGSAGVFGNAVAGWRGAIVGGVLTGLWLAIGQAITWGMLGNTAPELSALADPDWYVIAWLIMLAEPFVGGALVWMVPVVVVVATVAALILIHRRDLKREAVEAKNEEAEASTANAVS